jgi:acetyl-CoA C-acetyltransferase
MRDVVVVSAVRTPIGGFLGGFKKMSAVALAEVAVKGAIAQAGLKVDDIQDIVGGVVYKSGLKGNPARQVQLNLGIPAEAAATTVDQQCASGMRAFEIAVQQIQLNKSDISVAFGTESMSNVPHMLIGSRTGSRFGDQKLVDGLTYDALIDAFEGYHMGVTAENLAEEYNISRKEQDELSLLSHKRAINAINKGLFEDEIVPVSIKSKKGTTIVDRDEHPRADVNMENLKMLRPAFKKDGTVTAGNASGINDGAAAVVIMAAEKAEALGIKPLAKVVATASYGVEPRIMGIGPAYAIPKVLDLSGLTLDDIGYFEINEAFAAQFIACNRELKIPMNKVNSKGSGISLGHPVGATGVRIIVTLLHELKNRDDRYGIASLCVGGGPSMASLFERI